MKILLSGGGSPEQVELLDKYFSNYIGEGKILYIPVAMEKTPYNECENWFRKTYAKYNLNNIDICTDLSEIKTLEEYKGVFIGGGNTFKLLKEIKESDFDNLIKEYIKNDVLIYGGSAGAIIFGNTIETAIHADKNNVKLNDLNGLNLLRGYNVWCHYNETKDKKELLNSKKPTIVLYEESGILYDGDKFIALGKEYLKFPEDFK